MKLHLLFLFGFCVMTLKTNAQYFQQFFDGADTSDYALQIYLDTAAENSWQIGKPSKLIFDSAATAPNALMTDTINMYPVSNNSMFWIKIPVWDTWGILAVQWMQKLDLEQGRDGGIIEFYNIQDSVWENAFNSPYVYNFYGYLPENADTLLTGEYAFSGTDTSWRNIWLCYDFSWLTGIGDDTIDLRYRIETDTNDTQQEGWMIDDMIANITLMHTIQSNEQTDYFNIYPSPTQGIVHLEAVKLQQYHVIESLDVVNIQGNVVKHYGLSPTKFTIDIGELPSGMYLLRIKTNIDTKTYPVTLLDTY